jgi:hypothetical protein
MYIVMIECFNENDIRGFLQQLLTTKGYSVFKEINRIDLVAIKNGISLGFETKSSSGNCLKALGQAQRNANYVEFSYMVLPRTIIDEDFLQTVKQSKVGLILVNENLSFELWKDSSRFQPSKTITISRKKLKKRFKKKIHPMAISNINQLLH